MNDIKIVEATIDDDWEIRNVRYKTWLATYPSEKHEVTKEDVDSEFAKYPDTEEVRARLRNSHRKGYKDPNWRYYVAKNLTGTLICGKMTGNYGRETFFFSK
jgi:hypothetical protein